jgi:hypothetical protein
MPTHAGSGNGVDGNAVGFEPLENADVRQTECAAFEDASDLDRLAGFSGGAAVARDAARIKAGRRRIASM